MGPPKTAVGGISKQRIGLVSVLRGSVTGEVLIALNKPFGVLSQFTPEPGSKWTTLAGLELPKQIYPLGRLDADSEGLLLLSDEPGLNTHLLDPKYAHAREYWVQVERIPDEASLRKLATGVAIRGHATAPCQVARIEVNLPARQPPIRHRVNVPDCWLSLTLTEGKNRQVRRMTAAIGHPTLRLYRAAIGALQLPLLSLQPGEWKELNKNERKAVFAPR